MSLVRSGETLIGAREWGPLYVGMFDAGPYASHLALLVRGRFEANVWMVRRNQQYTLLGRVCTLTT